MENQNMRDEAQLLNENQERDQIVGDIAGHATGNDPGLDEDREEEDFEEEGIE